VIVCRDWSAEQLSAFRLMANRSATWAEWDLEAVAQEIAELSKTDFDLKLTGFDACEIEQFLAPVFDDQTLESVPETPHAMTSAPGDLWDRHMDSVRAVFSGSAKKSEKSLPKMSPKRDLLILRK
jgi:hypothetical protein